MAQKNKRRFQIILDDNSTNARHKALTVYHRVTQKNTPYTIINTENGTVFVWHNVEIEHNEYFYLSKVYWIEPIITEFAGKTYAKINIGADVVVDREEALYNHVENDPTIEIDDDDNFPF